MLTSLVVTLTPLKFKTPPEAIGGDYIRKLLYRWLKGYLPALSQEIHDETKYGQNKYSPFNVSPLQKTSVKNRYWLRICLMDKRLTGKFTSYLASLEGLNDYLYIKNTFHHFKINKIYLNPSQSANGISCWVKHKSFIQIASNDKYADLKSAPVSFSTLRKTVKGFTGKVVFKIRGANNDTGFLRQMNALADMAFFTGTSDWTSIGLGQTKRIKPFI